MLAAYLARNIERVANDGRGGDSLVVPILMTIASVGMRATVEAPRLLDGSSSTPMGVVADLTLVGTLARADTHGFQHKDRSGEAR